MKDRVEKALPPKLETQLACPLSAQQMFWCARDERPSGRPTVRPSDQATARSVCSSIALAICSSIAVPRSTQRYNPTTDSTNDRTHLARACVGRYRRLLLKDTTALTRSEEQAGADGGDAAAASSSSTTSYKTLMNLLMQLRKVRARGRVRLARA